jgi:hypothetical protein
MTTDITASATFHETKLKDIPVINPGDWFGKTWLIELGGSYTPLFLIVEADSLCDAIDELAENEKYGHQILVANEDLCDYPEEDRHYSGTGQVLDLDWLMVHGQEGSDCPFACRYFGKGLPVEGIAPADIWEHDPADCVTCDSSETAET